MKKLSIRTAKILGARLNLLQIMMGNQSITLNALQVASISSQQGVSMSGMLITGNKPFGAISGCMCGYTQETGRCDWEAVSSP